MNGRFFGVMITVTMLIGCDQSATQPTPPTKQGPPPGDDIAALQGEWRVISAETSEGAVPEEERAKVKIVIEGRRMTTYVGDEVEETVSIDVNSTRSPPEIDMYSIGEERKLVKKGIYKLDGGNWTLLITEAVDGDRPTVIASPEQPAQQLLSLQKNVK